MGRTIDTNEDLIEGPFVARARTTMAQGIGVLLAERAAPLPDGLVGDDDAALGEQLLHVPVAEREAEGQPDGVANDLRREPMPRVAGGGCLFIHAPSIAYSPVRETAQLT